MKNTLPPEHSSTRHTNASYKKVFISRGLTHCPLFLLLLKQLARSQWTAFKIPQMSVNLVLLSILLVAAVYSTLAQFVKIFPDGHRPCLASGSIGGYLSANRCFLLSFLLICFHTFSSLSNSFILEVCLSPFFLDLMLETGTSNLFL
jgi:hypothetical protein